MKYCPLCVCGELKEDEPRVCDSCGFVDKSVEELTKREKAKLLGSFDFEELSDGTYRIIGVKNSRDLLLRESVGVSRIVSEIGDRAMAHLKFMTELELPAGLRVIGDEAFASCKGLCKVFIPETVKSVGKGIFKDCHELKEIYCQAESMPEGWDGGWLDGCDAYPFWGMSGI